MRVWEVTLGLIMKLARNFQSPCIADSVYTLFKLKFIFVLKPILSTLYTYRLIGLVGRVFANDLGDLGSIPGQVIPKTFLKKGT